MEIELQRKGIPFESQKVLIVRYKDQILQKQYCVDLLCYGQLLVELKAMKELLGREDAQLLNYLKATGYRVGLLINFGDAGRLDWRHLVR